MNAWHVMVMGSLVSFMLDASEPVQKAVTPSASTVQQTAAPAAVKQEAVPQEPLTQTAVTPAQQQAVPAAAPSQSALPSDKQEAEKKEPVQAQTVAEQKPSAAQEPHMPAAPAVVEESAEEKKRAAEEEKAEAEKKAKAGRPQKPTIIDEGIDTIDQDGGNWLLKRQALEKTIDVIEKIKDVFTKILEIRIDYLVKRNQTDRAFDMFANSIGFEIGDLNQLLTTLVTQLKAERKRDGDLDEEERTILEEIENRITELKGLKTTLQSITDLDASLDDALMQVEKEITTSNSYQTRAWKNFQTIKRVLSDEKAEEIYLQTESLLKNMQDILNYLQGDLLQYFNSIIDSLKQAMNDTQDKIKGLAQKGINLKDEVKKIKKSEKLARKKKLEEAQKAQKKKEEPKTQPKEVKKTSWFDTIAILWRYPISLVTSSWNYVTSFFITPKTVEVIKRETPAGVIKQQEENKQKQK